MTTEIKHTILCVDDEPPILSVLRKILEDRYVIFTVSSGEDALDILNRHEVAVVIVDQKMPSMSGVELLKHVKESYPYTVRIVLTAYADIHDLVDSVNLGEIYRYIHKPWETQTLLDVLADAIKKYEENIANAQRKNQYERLAIEKAKLEQEIVVLKSEIEKEFSLDNIISVSPEMNEVRRLIKSASVSDETVLIQGESGTGKELVAKAIHFNSKRQHNKFTAIDCGALAENLLESELFGHKKGAFTGAFYDKKGLFEEAEGGTVFLDEISNTSLALQAKLLRVIQEKEIRRIGETHFRRVDVRIISATNKDLYEEFRKETFREDLYYRLNVIPVQLPPLRNRRSDIPILINHFINDHNRNSEKKVRSISQEVLNFLCSREWKGNVRELKNLINRMLIFAESDSLSLNDIPEEFRRELHDIQFSKPPDATNHFEFKINDIKTIEELERSYIRYILHQTGANKAEAAKLLGMKRTTLLMRMKKLGLMA